MGAPNGGGHPRIPPAGILAAALAALILFLLPPAHAAEVKVASDTYGLYYKRDAAGEKKTHFPAFEYLSLDAGDLGGKPLSFHFYGWGRVDLADQTGRDKSGGDVGSAYLRYVHPTGNGEVRLGRFFLAEGAAMEALDGALLKMRLPIGVGAALFGGVPVEQSITATKRGDNLFGARVFFNRAGFVELGASYLREKGTFAGDDREELGADLWLRPGGWIELTGRGSYNLSTTSFNSHRTVVRLFPVKAVDIAGGYEAYEYKGLFQTALNPAFRDPSIDVGDKVRVAFVILDWRATDALTFEAVLKSIAHDRDDPGTANRGELGVRYGYNEKKDVAGISAAVVAGDRDENEYQEVRAFGSYSRGPWRFAVDALADRYKEEINGEKATYQVVASAGFRPMDVLKISGDVTYTRSPQFDKDVAGLVRLTWTPAVPTGGTK